MDATRTPATRRPTRSLRGVVAILAAAAAVLAAVGIGFAQPVQAQEGPSISVDPASAGIGESFIVANFTADCDGTATVAVDGLGLWAPDVHPTDGAWAVQFTVPTEDVLAGTYEVTATCVIPGTTDSFQYSPAAIVVPPFSPAQFPDVPTTHPFFDEIGWMVDEGLTTGYADGTFRPTWAASRQAIAAQMYRLAGSPYGASPECTADQFVDVPVGHPFCGEIGWMVEEGITTGYADGTFRPTDAVTRQAIAAFLYRFADEPYGPVPLCTADQFADVPVGHLFCGEIGWMVEEQITEGYGDFTFRPTVPTARQAVAAFFARFSAES